VSFVRGLCHQGDPARPVALMTCTFVLADRISAVGGIET
jgi:hypothetical protein